jgi:hypothetical protein
MHYVVRLTSETEEESKFFIQVSSYGKGWEDKYGNALDSAEDAATTLSVHTMGSGSAIFDKKAGYFPSVKIELASKTTVTPVEGSSAKASERNLKTTLSISRKSKND